MASDLEGEIGSVQMSECDRRILAERSRRWNWRDKKGNRVDHAEMLKHGVFGEDHDEFVQNSAPSAATKVQIKKRKKKGLSKKSTRYRKLSPVPRALKLLSNVLICLAISLLTMNFLNFFSVTF